MPNPAKATGPTLSRGPPWLSGASSLSFQHQKIPGACRSRGISGSVLAAASHALGTGGLALVWFQRISCFDCGGRKTVLHGHVHGKRGGLVFKVAGDGHSLPLT